LRERGKTVVGFGMKQTVSGFVNAFSEFIYLDRDDDNEAPAKMTAEKKARVKAQPILSRAKFNALSEVLDRLIEKNGKAYYSLILSEMKNKYSDFIPKNYGCRSMKEFMAKIMANTKKYEIMTDTDGTSMYIVPKKNKNAQ
ncbi:MAG: OST-HTH/LOTUS domain-containing protein, partial [Eubacteriales bacterium]